MRNVNVVVLTGNLTRDLELKHGASGTAFARGGLAVNSFYGGEEKVSFFDFVVFGKSAEVLAEHGKKGSGISLRGELRQDTFEVDGQKRSKVEVVCQEWGFLGGGKKEEGEAGEKGQSPKTNPKKQNKKDESEQDVPF